MTSAVFSAAPPVDDAAEPSPPDGSPALAIPPPPFETVAAIARLIGERLELRQVFARVAEAALGALAFDRMSVLLLEGENAQRHYAVAVTARGGASDERGRLRPRDDCSPRCRREFVVDRIDTARELDPT